MHLRNLMVFVTIFLAACQATSLPATQSLITDPIEVVRQAYQIDTLMAAKWIRLEDDVRQTYPDHEYGPDFHDLSLLRRHIVLDFKNQRGSSEYLSDIANSFYHGRRLLIDGQSKFIMYATNRYEIEEERTFFDEYGRTVRGSDTLLAMWLVQSAKNVRVEEDEVWMGELHHKISMDFPQSPRLILLINKQTGFITKMTRIIGENTKVSYTYTRHKRIDGITTATEHYVFAGPRQLFHSTNRRVVIDDPNDRDAFKIDEGVELEPERVDQSLLTVDKINNAIYHVGQDDAYSTFVDTGEGLLAFGLQAGFSERLAVYRERVGNSDQLRYAVATDHHQSELASIADAVNQGATILVTSDAINRAREMVTGVSDAKIENVTEVRHIGSMKVMPLSTSHAAKVLVGYESEQRLLMQMSHWVKIYKNASVHADFGAFTLHRALLPHALNPRKILSTESRLLSDWQIFVDKATKFKRVTCYKNRPICKNWV